MGDRHERRDKALGVGWEHPVFLWVARPLMHFAFWLLLSGHLEAQFLVLGLVASLIATAMTKDLLRPSDTGGFDAVPTSITWLVQSVVRFLLYLPYLLWQVLKSNLSVAYVVLHPRMPIAPRLVEFETPLRMEPSQVLLAQSITLTPGTVTVDVRNGRFLVHALLADAAETLTQGDMPRRVGAVFGIEGRIRFEATVIKVANVSWFYEER